jgi:hypothetical protein
MKILFLQPRCISKEYEMPYLSRLTTVVLLALGLIGCSGHLYTIVSPSLGGQDKKVEGVITYQPVNVIELYKTTIRVDKESGNILGSSATGGCTEDKMVKFSTRADYSKPQLVGYAPGLLDKNKFGVTLKDGVIASVNSESDPTSGLKDLAAVLPFVKAPFGEKSNALPIEGKPLCNAGEKFIGLYLTPKILPFESMPE